MHQELRKNASYPKTLTLLCISSALFGIGCILVGYIMFPFAAASFAALLQCEKKNSRICSYVIPIMIFAINLLLNGFFSLEGILYAAFAFILFLLEEKHMPKSDIVFCLSALTSAFIFLSFVTLAFDSSGSLSFGALKTYYAGVYGSFKKIFISLMTAISTADDEGVMYFLFNRESAEEVFHSILLSLPAFIIISAFVLTGISYKFYNFLKVRVLSVPRESLRTFVPNKLSAVSYVVVAILSLISSDGTDVFALTIMNLNSVLTVAFAYFGFKLIYTILRATRGTVFTLIIIGIALFAFTSTAITLLSFIGVFFALSATEIPADTK